VVHALGTAKPARTLAFVYHAEKELLLLRRACASARTGSSCKPMVAAKDALFNYATLAKVLLVSTV